MATGTMLWIHFAVPQRPHDHEAELLECNKSFLEEDFGGDFDYSRIYDDENVETAYGKSMRHDFERFCILYMYSSVVSIQSTNVYTMQVGSSPQSRAPISDRWSDGLQRR